MEENPSTGLALVELPMPPGSVPLVRNERIRNVAIIAHVDHGKTTLVDAMVKQSGVFREGKALTERLMDTMELEREKGITIAAKNCALHWAGVKINIIDTPGHADFGGEVERAISMADGAILLVDAAEGPLPQTRFVLEKALHAGLEIIVVINKIDREDSRPAEVLEDIYELFIDLGAHDHQIEFPVFYAVGRDGIAKRSLDAEAHDISALFDTIVSVIPGPEYDPQQPLQMLVSDLGYSDYLGRLAIGKVHHGSVRSNDALVCLGQDGPHPLKVSRVQAYEGLGLREMDVVETGDIAVLSGIEDVKIGDTICTREQPLALPRIEVDEPTVSMVIRRNDGPLSGKEGRWVQTSKIGERLERETLKNVGIHVEATPDREGFVVKGRGEFQISILVETMRREGYEVCVGRPEVILKRREGKVLEPVEDLIVDCPETYVGVVSEKISQRRGFMMNMLHQGSGRVRLEFSVPSRALIGYRDEFLTDTKGTGTMSSRLTGYEEHRGEFPSRFTGSLVSDREGKAVAYAIFSLEPRGRLFVVPGDPVYEGMVVGEHARDNDLDVNPCREKKQTNMRAAGRDENVILTPVVPMTLERAIRFIGKDELVEVTPTSIRLRKEILNQNGRLQASRRARWAVEDGEIG
jgi:GTP-binding protein